MTQQTICQAVAFQQDWDGTLFSFPATCGLLPHHAYNSVPGTPVLYLL